MAKAKNPALSQKLDLYYDRGKKTIQQWLQAYTAAELKMTKGKITPPNKQLLMSIYDSIMLDNHLASVWESRKSKVLGEPFAVYDANGKIHEEATEKLQKRWFTDNDTGFISKLLDAKAYGYSLIGFEDFTDEGEIKKVKVINRANVIPELNLVVQKPGAKEGIDFTKDAYYPNYLLAEGDGLGFLLKAAPDALYKRYAKAAWMEHVEVHALDFLVGKTDVEDQDKVAKLLNSLKTAGRNRMAVINYDEEFETVSQGNTDPSGMYKTLAEYSDGEISKLVLGATGISDIGGNYKEAGNHQQVVEERAEGDREYAENYVTDELFPRLALMSDLYKEFAQEGLYFQYTVREKISYEDKRKNIESFKSLGLNATPEDIQGYLGLPFELKVTEGAQGGGEIFGYHIETGVVNKNEVRAQLGLEEEDMTGEEERRSLLEKLSVMKAAKDAGVPLTEAAKLAGLSITIKEEDNYDSANFQ